MLLLTVQRLQQLVESEQLKFILLIPKMLPLYLVITMNLLFPLLIRGKISVSVKKLDFLPALFSYISIFCFID